MDGADGVAFGSLGPANGPAPDGGDAFTAELARAKQQQAVAEAKRAVGSGGDDRSAGQVASNVSQVATTASHTASEARSGFWRALKDAASGALDTVGNVASDVGHTVEDAASGVVNTVENAATDIGHTVLDAGKGIVDTAEKVGGDVASGNFGQALGDAADGVVTTTGHVLDDAAHTVIDTVSGPLDTAGRVVTDGEQAVADAATGVVSTAGHVVSGVAQTVAQAAGPDSMLGQAAGAVGSFATAAADGVNSTINTVTDFNKGVVEGVVGGVEGMAKGVVSLGEGVAKEGYALATDEKARESALATVEHGAEAICNFEKNLVTDPSKALNQVEDAASGAVNTVKTTAGNVYKQYQAAAAQGHGAEFIGKGVGQAAVVVAGAVLTDGAGLAGEGAAVAGEGAAVVGELSDGAATLSELSEGGAALSEGAETGATALEGGGAAGGRTGLAVEEEATTAAQETANQAGSNASRVEPPKGARGPSSGRDFDPEKAGGPIEPRSLDDVKITHETVDQVEAHISRFGRDPHNEAMLARQRAIADGKLETTFEDKAFHAHEIDEYQRYQNLGFKEGLPEDEEAQAELWNNTHSAALEDYRMSETELDPMTGKMRSTLYHPSCDPRLLPHGWTLPPGYPFNE